MAYSSASVRTWTGNGETYNNKENIKVVERFFDLPLDYSNQSSSEKIRVFARSLIPRDKVKTPEDEDRLPYVVYLQGGPGFEVPMFSTTSFSKEFHDRGYQTLLLDPRGTGLSTALSYETLPARVKTDQDIADYCKFFRADSIVKDCESIRKILLGHKQNPEDQKWTVLGQSFGGFCSMTYLSFHPEGLKEVFNTGGLQPLIDHPDPNYELTVQSVIKRNEIYYKKFPQDIKRVRDIMSYLASNDITTPNGGRLSVRRFQMLGMDFGMDHVIDRVHELVFRAASDLELFGKMGYKTLQLIQDCAFFDGNPIYAILHEPIYCQGKAPKWSAARIVDSMPQHFSWDHIQSLAETTPIYFTGEMILREIFDDFVNLRPLKGAAEILANDSSWGPILDVDQLARNEVKVSVACYYEDMCVPFKLSQEAANQVKNVKQYITNQLFHNGIRVASKDVVGKLFELSRREYE